MHHSCAYLHTIFASGRLKALSPKAGVLKIFESRDLFNCNMLDINIMIII